MEFKLEGMRRAALGACLAAALVAGCGGGGEQVDAFSADRVLAFGDESSVITSTGAKYSVNALTTGTSTLDCTTYRLWIQHVADRWSLVFPQCNPDNVPAPESQIYAQVGATVDGLVAQIDQRVIEGGFDGKTLATVLVGANDILAQYARLSQGVSEDELVTALTEAGQTAAEQVNRIADLGGKVLVSTVPDLGLSPFAKKEELINVGRADALSRLTLAFNRAMRAALDNDGRKIGLVLTDERTQLISKNGDALGFDNTDDAACTVALPRCTTSTLVDDPDSTTVPPTPADPARWLWADDTHLAPGGQSAVGDLAEQRAENNPF